MFKKLLATLLAGIMLLGAVPVSASTNDPNELKPHVESTDNDNQALLSELKAKLNSNNDVQTFDFGDDGHNFDEYEPNDTLEDATVMDPNDTMWGSVTGKDGDVFCFQIDAHYSVELIFVSDTFNCLSGLYDNNGKLIKQLEYLGEEDGLYLSYLKIDLPSNYWTNNYYYIWIYHHDGLSSQYGLYYNNSLVSREPSPFLDVRAGIYYYNPVLWAYEENIVAGTSAIRFSPDAECNRGQVVSFLWRAAGRPEPTSTTNPFIDVLPGDYYYKAVLWAVEQGITKGTGANTFSPNKTCTRAQVVSFLWNASNKPEPTTLVNPFVDVPSDAYFFKPVLWAAENRITSGVSATEFGAYKPCTRGQVVTFLYKYYN